jgi:UDP-2-acetamido-3-amino-2,3-dideoxy-glucuronate N-acetyltransferase
MSCSKPQVAVIGCGYWGKNLVRNFFELGALRCVCDPKQEVLDEARSRYDVRMATDIPDVLADPEIDAVVIAAPAVQHYDLARRSLAAGKDVYVEKPLALHADEGRQLIELAAEQQKILMVGHILQYHPAILQLKQLIRDGEFGQLQYIYSSRLNLGKLRSEENILWSFAPHDISAVLYLLDELPARVSSHGGTYLNSQIFDTTVTTCDFRSGVKAHIFVSWLHPFKEQKLTIVGSKRMAVFDDVESERKLTLYSHRIDWLDRMPVAHRDDGQVVSLPKEEPLRRECEHFLDCVSTRRVPRTAGESGVQVLRVLEACEHSLHLNGLPVDLSPSSAAYQAHPTAVIDEAVEIGEGTRVWHFSHIMSKSSLGKNCNLGQNVVVSPGVTIGNNVKIQNNVSVYTGVELEDDVFCGPSMVFTNVVNPRSHIVRKNEFRRTLVKKGASIGANATVVCGCTLGKYSFVAAGAVVTRDVPDYGLVMGVPAMRVGWMCYCGVRLPDSEGECRCPACRRVYFIENESCREVTSAETTVPLLHIAA